MEQFSKIRTPFACTASHALLLGRSPLRSSLGQSVSSFASRPKRLAVRPSQQGANVSNRGHSEVVVQSRRVFRSVRGVDGSHEETVVMISNAKANFQRISPRK